MILTDTPICGHKKRDLNDPAVANQLWIITRDGNAHLIQNAAGRTYMDLYQGH